MPFHTSAEQFVSLFLGEKVKEDGREKVKQKFDWMFNRITSEKAKQIAQPRCKCVNPYFLVLVQKFNFRQYTNPLIIWLKCGIILG
ncbi:MAG: hypothetical protein A2538_04460 [Candidatus Magasanikbacteria bacterium RIFOXYD2_FULL_41_14]|uniref:Uncharacterized protein n=1 Tax=Candidatus Magasanikbacteria bacterium RIFOXYD2_FULL_41_14 TaxID=1798709 RepID=A0A1F6PFE9_9BACT|nr:MAG: hypothetical protein A2538_04460 [Candidatus Magasanikbacteria bacterium RIFOXYD2_FULL_41_14]